MIQIDLCFDGACDNNSKLKLMGSAVACFIGGEHAPQYDRYAYTGNGTSNIAEWEALLMALGLAKELKGKIERCSIRIYGDSQLIVRQFTGKYRVRQPHLREYYRECKQKYYEIGQNVRIDWIRRDENKVADELSKRAIKEFIKENIEL